MSELRLVVALLVIFMAVAPVAASAAEADDSPPVDHIARAAELLKTYKSDPPEFFSLRQSVQYALHRDPTIRDASTILPIKAFFCSSDVSSLSRAENLLLIACWQRRSGAEDEAMGTLREALVAAERGYTSRKPPPSGYYTNHAERIAHRLIEWGAAEDEVLRAVDLSAKVRLHDPHWFDPRYTKTAAEAARHELVGKLVEREKTSLRQARAWADAAIGYHENGDSRRTVAAAKRCIEVMDRNDSATMTSRRLSKGWRFEIAEILHGAGEFESARRAVRHAEMMPVTGLSPVGVAAAWIRIGEDAEARRLIEEYYAKIPEVASNPREEARMRERPWIIIAEAFAERGEIEKADEALANIPATSQDRMRGVRLVGNLLLEKGDPDSKRAAREFFTRHAPLAAAVEKIPDDKPSGDYEETVLCAQVAVRAGAVDAVEEHFLPAMTAKEREHVLPFLATMSAGLSVDERIERYISPLPDPADRVRFLGGNATRIRDDDELRKIERMILQEKDHAMASPTCTLTRLAIHRQSLKHWDRARELFELSLALISEMDQTRQRAWQLQFFQVSAWLHGHSDLAREAARQLIDVAWESRSQKIEHWDGSVRGNYILEAKQLLEATGESGRFEAANDKRIEARFVAEVKWIEVIGKREATAVPIGIDPRWLVRIEIKSIEQAAPLFKQKGEVVLAIHSPVRLFAQPGERVVGKSFSFRVTGQLSDGRSVYIDARATERP